MFYFAWVDSTETAFTPALARGDEDVFAFEVNHAEGDFAVAVIDIRNPRVGLLAPGRKLWAWLSWDGGDTGGPEPLFFGRLVGVPVDLDRNIVRLSFRARPADYDLQVAALAATMREQPYWDPVWISPERRDEADTVLESRSALWHIDRISHVVTASDIISGDGGTLALDGDDIVADSLQFSLSGQPLRQVTIEADAYWNQQDSGTVDVSGKIVEGFAAAGSEDAFTISSYTGQGLADDWPQEGDDIGGGWKVGPVDLRRVDGITSHARYKKVDCKYRTAPTEDTSAGAFLPPSDGTTYDHTYRINVEVPVTVRFRLWKFLVSMVCAYEASRSRKETLRFTMTADVQPLFTDSADEEQEILKFSSNEIGEPIDADGTDTVRPIRDMRRAQYFPTDRGLQSIEYLLAVARARILARARAVTMQAAISFGLAAQLNCRMNASLTHENLPGGVASGKIVGYGFACDGNTGELTGQISIGCTIGRGNSVAASAGSPVYVEDGYVEDGYQQRSGARVAPIGSDIYYEPPTAPPNDDGIDFFNMTADNVVESVTVTNGETAQAAALRRKFLDIAAAVTGLNAVYTQVSLVLTPVEAGPFEQTHELVLSDLMVPKTLDLETA